MLILLNVAGVYPKCWYFHHC